MSTTQTLPNPTGTNANILRYLQANKTGFPSFNGDVLFGVANISAHVAKLRAMGYCIYSNPKRDACGPFVQYRLGKPTRRVVAAGMKAVANQNAKARRAKASKKTK